MNQSSDVQELSSCDGEPQQKKVLHFSSGEILTESEEEEDEHELHQTFCVSEQGNWSLKEQSRFWGTRLLRMSLKICDFFGEKMAALLGLNGAKYQYAIDQYDRHHENKTGDEIVPVSIMENVERLHLSQTVSKPYGSTNDFKDQHSLNE